MLLEAGANINHQEKVCIAMYNLLRLVYSVQCVYFLPGQLGQTAVYCASAKGYSEVVAVLVQAGADLELYAEVYICCVCIHMP